MRVSVVILDKSRKYLILIKRVKENRQYDVLPGGQVEAGESSLNAAIREIKEELAIEMNASDIIDFLNYEDHCLFVVKTKRTIGPLTIHGEELQRSHSNNRYHPRWILVEDSRKMTIFPEFDFDLVNQVINPIATRKLL